MKSRIVKNISFIVKVAVAATLIYFLFHFGQLKIESLRTLFTPQTVLVALVLLGFNHLLLNWRWYWLLRSRDFQVTSSQTFVLYLIGIFFNHALPSSVGGDVVKAYYLAREQKNRRMEAVLSVLLDRILGLYSLLLMALVSVVVDAQFVLSHPEIKAMATLTLLISLAMSVSFIVGFSQRINNAIGLTRFLKKHPRLEIAGRVIEAMHLYGRHRSVIATSIAASILAQSMTIVLFMYLGSTLGYHDIPWTAYLFCVPLGFVAMALPIAPAGVGVGQIAFLFLFHAYVPTSGDLGATAITAFQLALLAWGLIGAVFYVRYKKPEELANA